VHSALRQTAEKMAKLENIELMPNPVKQIASNYYVVNVNANKMNANALEFYLNSSFGSVQLHMDYEYGIYDCTNDKMVYGNYIHANQAQKTKSDTIMPKWSEFPHYFSVRFPNKNIYLAGQMDIWLFSSLLMLIIFVFLGFTLSVILRQKRLSQVQRDFINNMTHEFKTPISTIAVSTDLITNPKILNNPEKILTYAQIIRTQNTRLKNQIDKVLQMAVMDKGKFTLKKETMDLRQLLQEAVDNFNLKEETNIHLDCDLPTNVAQVQADRVHFTNIIYNLLDNGTKYVHEDITPEIFVRAFLDKNEIAISIKDNGIGIAKEHQKKIFDKFFRVPTGNVHDVKGFGLGLNYVRIIVKEHHWRITLESAVGKGSTFTIYIPAQSA
jgi:two-component system phosphate regulon sensor histidine kinase PhoR